MQLEQFLQQLSGVKKASGGHVALCPAHDDKTPSLSITTGDTGNILLHCHVGCSNETVLSAIGLSWNDLFPKRNQLKQKTQIVATYDYRDEAGSILFQTVRLEPKSFRARHRVGKNWNWSLNGTRRVLYRLPELLQTDKAFPVFIVEGEKDADNLTEIGVAATCNPLGAGKWRDEYSISLKDRHCVILPDNDKAGEEHAMIVAKSLLSCAEKISILRLPNIPDKGDVSDWLAKGNTCEDLYALLSGADNFTEADFVSSDASNISTEASVASSRDAKETQSSRLMRIAQDAELFHTTDGDAFATISVNSHKETFPIKSRDFRDWLSLRHWNKERAMPSSQAVQDVVYGLSGQARFEGETRGVYLRIAENCGSLYLDLGNERWDVVKISRDGWSVESDHVVKFRRTRGTMALPTPEKGGSINDLRRFVNVTDEDWPLVLAWLAAALRPNKPFPVLVLHGEQGSGKSTTAKVLRLLIDPNKSPLRSSPKDERDLMIAANNSWIISLDNLSSMTVGLSDSLCRLSTGGGFATRELFTDSDELLMSLTRPILLNGIDEVISRSDLLDRAIMLHLPRLTRRFDETSFWTDFEAARPRILGALLDAACYGLSKIDDVTARSRNEQIELPRLADFAIWGIATEEAFSFPCGQFMSRYDDNRAGIHDLALDSDVFAEVILKFMQHRPLWTGTASKLFEELCRITSENITRAQASGFPKNPKAVGKRLSLLAPNLREHGVEYSPPDRSKRDRRLTLQKTMEIEP